jgi:hypothetical protein
MKTKLPNNTNPTNLKDDESTVMIFAEELRRLFLGGSSAEVVRPMRGGRWLAPAAFQSDASGVAAQAGAMMRACKAEAALHGVAGVKAEGGVVVATLVPHGIQKVILMLDGAIVGTRYAETAVLEAVRLSVSSTEPTELQTIAKHSL